MKVLLSATSLRAESIGGGETFILDLANGLASDGCSVTLAIGKDAHARLGGRADPSIDIMVVAQRHGLLRVLSDFVWTARRARRSGAELLIYPHEWKPPTSTPTLIVVQNVLWMHPLTARSCGTRGVLLRLLTRITGRRADAVAAVSSAAADLWQQTSRARPNLSSVVPEGLVFQSGTVTPEPLHSGILAISGVAAYKGLALLEATARAVRTTAPEFVLDVVGVAVDDSPGVAAHGFVDRSRLLAMMRGAALVVFPSEVESFGLPAFEAATLGVRCVVRAGTPMHEWLGDKVITFDGSLADLARVVSAALDGNLPEGTPTDEFLWPNVSARWMDVCRRATAVRP